MVGALPGGAGLPPWGGASGVRRCPSPGRPPFGAGSRGSAARVSRVWLVWASPTVCALLSCRCALWGWRKGVPGEGAFRRCQGRLSSGARPPPAARPRGGCRGPLPTCCGCGCAGGGAQHCPLGLHALLGAAGRRGGGRPSPGGWPSTLARGVWVLALLLPLLPALWVGCGGPPSTCCGRRCRCVWHVWCLCGVCALAGAWRCGSCCGAWCCSSSAPLVPPSLVLCCGVVPVVCLPCPSLLARPALVCWLPSSFFCCCGALYPFLYSPLARPPPWLVLFSCLRPGVCLGLSPCLPPWSRFTSPLLSLLLGPVRQRKGVGVGFRAAAGHSMRATARGVFLCGRVGAGTALHTILVTFVRCLFRLCAAAWRLTYLHLCWRVGALGGGVWLPPYPCLVWFAAPLCSLCTRVCGDWHVFSTTPFGSSHTYVDVVIVALFLAWRSAACIILALVLMCVRAFCTLLVPSYHVARPWRWRSCCACGGLSLQACPSFPVCAA